MNAVGNARYIAGVFDIIKQNREFVAAETSHCIYGTQARYQPLHKPDKQFVPNRMAKAIVDNLEAIDI